MDTCSCGQPIADCPHLGVFDSPEHGATREERLAAKRAWFMDLDAAMAEIDAFGTRAEAKRAVEIAKLAAERAQMLPVGSDLSQTIAVVVAALAKAALLLGLG